MAGLDDLQNELEQIEGINIVTTEEPEEQYKGTLLVLTLSKEFEGRGDELVGEIYDTIPRDMISLNEGDDFNIDRTTVYRDTIEVYL